MTVIDLEDGRKGECQGVREKCSLPTDECPRFGRLLKPSRSDNKQRVQGCGDKVATGVRSKRRGGKGQRQAAKWLGVPNTSSIKTGHEEFSPGLIRFESKDGAQSKPVFTWYDKVKAQSDAARALGNNRVFVGTATMGGRTIFLIDAAHADDFAVALVTQKRLLRVVDL